MSLLQLIYVCLGGALGSGCRFAISKFLPLQLHRHFPIDTLLVNIVGSFLIGLCYSLFQKHLLSAPQFLLLTTGFLGGFTTFSAMSLEVITALNKGIYLLPFVYILISLVGGIGFAWLGIKAGS